MSYARIAATADARAYSERRAREDEAEVQKRLTPGGQRMMANGMTCQEWIDQYLGRNRPVDVTAPNTESEHGDQDRREATGPQAAEVGAGESLGNPPSEQDPSVDQASDQSVIERDDPRLSAHSGAGTRLADPGSEDSWVDEAWPEGSQGADFTEKDRTPS